MSDEARDLIDKYVMRMTTSNISLKQQGINVLDFDKYNEQIIGLCTYIMGV